MNINVYLPDEVGVKAREAGLNLSRLLREAVISELEHLQAVAAARDGMTPQRVQTGNGERQVILRFTGKHLAGDVWLTEAGKVVVAEEEDHFTFDSATEFQEWVEDTDRRTCFTGDVEQAFQDALADLGLPWVVDVA